MFIKFNLLNNFMKKVKSEGIPNNIYLCFDNLIGFHFKDEKHEDSNTYNTRWGKELEFLNKQVGIEEYLTVSEIASHLKISVNSIYNIIKEQDKENPILPYVDTSRGIRIKNIDYIIFLEKHYIFNYQDDVGNIENLDE